MKIAVDNELRLKYFDQLVAAIGGLPDTKTPGEAAAFITAILDVAGAAACGINGVHVGDAKELIDGWVQEALDGIGRRIHAMKPQQPPRPRLTLVP